MNCDLVGKPRYLFKEQEEQMLGRETPPSTKHSLKFSVDLPSPQNAPSENISPIKSLNPFQNNWTIKGRVTNKRKMHQYNTAKHNGQVFSFDIIDEEGCEIRITSFDEIAELHYHRVEQGAAYVVSKGSVKDANIVYNKLNNHLEIVLTETSVLKRCAPDFAEPSKKTHFTPINEVLTTTNNTLVDVIGAVVNVREISIIRRKDGSIVNKRIVKLNDMSTLTIDVNLWGPPSEQLGNDLKNMHASGTFVILAVQNARFGYFNGKVINISASTTFKINPSIPEVDPLHLRGPVQQFLDSHSLDVHAKNNQYKRMSIASILERLSVVPETIETTITAVLRFIKGEQFYYTTCPLQFNGLCWERRPWKGTKVRFAWGRGAHDGRGRAAAKGRGAEWRPLRYPAGSGRRPLTVAAIAHCGLPQWRSLPLGVAAVAGFALPTADDPQRATSSHYGARKG
ncbi:replication protein A 70 kDa DNA-binding subunit A-like [Cryptomeria japonica]|uniref:replication protein A 70 kDa DNA-binding subunit A-like n=1 Tax=Cryptomeria japonica TaxID=3369 RepID=UPI0027DA0557|nr:replication protein A 70 kDa DNA-binding subunit A-like [Cryptomeria japonica]